MLLFVSTLLFHCGSFHEFPVETLPYFQTQAMSMLLFFPTLFSLKPVLYYVPSFLMFAFYMVSIVTVIIIEINANITNNFESESSFTTDQQISGK